MSSSYPAQPSTRPKEVQKNEPQPEKAKENEQNVEEMEKDSGPKITEVTLRKGLFLTSSIGLKLDMYDLQDKLDSDVCAVGTYHIEQNEKARDPELYLKKNLQKIEDKSDLDFLIIATGTNDITVLDVENSL